MSMKSLQRRRTAYTTRIKLIKMRHNTTAKTNDYYNSMRTILVLLESVQK